jgi:membrane protein implicated in regulation of membrane protease activity
MPSFAPVLTRVVNLVLRITDLVEAEGRAARRAVAELVVAGVVLLMAGALGSMAFLAFSGALAMALWPIMPPPVALGIVGGIMALAAFLAAGIGRRMARPER